jgi:hypothetical protein
MKCFKSIVAAATIGVFAAGAIADSVSFNAPVSVTPSFTSATTTFAPSLQQFNSSLGTLTGVSVSLNVTVTPIVSVLNLSPTAQPIFSAATATNPASVGSTGPDTPFTVVDPYDATNTVSTDYYYAITNQMTTAGQFTVTNFSNPTASSLAALVSTVPGADFMNYVGSSTYDLLYTLPTETSTSSGSGGLVGVGGTWEIDGTATVTYTYTPSSVNAPPSVPLPAAATGGLALMGLIAARKK